MQDINNSINKSINSILKDAMQICLKNPLQAGFLAKILHAQQKAAKVRLRNENLGIHVPPFMIASITHRCNLKCKGCYAQVKHSEQGSEMSADKLKKVIGEAKDLGISIILLAGGEPLIRKDEIFKITSEFPDILFPLFTNGMLINNDIINILKHQRNVIPIVSIEGYKEDTDGRRGLGVYEYLKNTFDRLNEKGLFFGTSITLTSSNYDTVTNHGFIKELIAKGCKLFFFVEYVPVKSDTEDLVLTEYQRKSILETVDSFRKDFPGLFIAFPGDEEALGGCLAAGRGFIHISPEGNLEPCPFAPFSDTNLNEKPLKEALKSEFLSAIRQNHSLLVEGKGGCALWDHHDLVQSLLGN